MPSSPGIPSNAERGGKWRERWIDLAHALAVRDGVLLPAEKALHDIAGLELRILRR